MCIITEKKRGELCPRVTVCPSSYQRVSGE